MRLVLGALGLATCVACGTNVDSPLSQDEALSRLPRYAQAVGRAALGPDARVVGDGYENPDVQQCSDSYDPPRGTAVQGTSIYEVRGTRPEDGRTYVHRIRRLLEAHGWRKHPSGSTDSYNYQRQRFAVLFTFRPETNYLQIVVASPCVKPKDLDDPLGGSG